MVMAASSDLGVQELHRMLRQGMDDGFGAHGCTHRPQPVQAEVSMRTKASSTSLPEGLTWVSRR